FAGGPGAAGLSPARQSSWRDDAHAGQAVSAHCATRTTRGRRVAAASRTGPVPPGNPDGRRFRPCRRTTRQSGRDARHAAVANCRRVPPARWQARTALMATLVLSTVGTALAGPIGGLLGSLVGQSIDEQLLGGGPRKGPRLGDL